MTVDGLGFKPFAQKVIDILCHLVVVHRFNRHVHPQDEMSKDVHIILYRVRGEIASFQESSVIHNRVGDGHGFASFL